MRRAAAAVLCILLSIPSVASAQSKLVETIEVRVTNVDVVVTDKKGNPIVGLTRDDFEIYENGKLQPITNFYEVRPESVNTVAGMPPADETAVLAPAEVRQRKIIFFIDNQSLHPLRRNEVFASIDKFFDKLFQPGDQAMVVTWNRGLRMVAPFTDDAARLRGALKKISLTSGGGPQLQSDRERLKNEVQEMIAQTRSVSNRQRGSNPMDETYQQSLSMTRAYAEDLYVNEKHLASAMSTMITTLAGLEGKKVMVFVGAQLPDKPGFDVFQWIDQTFASFNNPPVAYREASRYSLSGELEKVAKQANANNVTMYMIDGADPTKGTVADASSTDQLDPTVDFIDFTNTANSLGAMARMTGGIALMRTNNFDLALNTVARDLGAYYSLGYRQSDDKPGDRKIVVKTKNREFKVRSRQSYVAKSADEQTQDRVISNAFHSHVKSDIPITLTTGEPVAQKGRYKVPVRISFPSNLTLLPDGDNLVGGFTVYFAVVDENGGMSPVSKRSQPVKLPKTAEAALRSKPISFTAEVLVAPGEHYISVGIVDDVASSAGFARTRVAAR